MMGASAVAAAAAARDTVTMGASAAGAAAAAARDMGMMGASGAKAADSAERAAATSFVRCKKL